MKIQTMKESIKIQRKFQKMLKMQVKLMSSNMKFRELLKMRTMQNKKLDDMKLLELLWKRILLLRNEQSAQDGD